jgi:ubiquitin-like protein Nedd8
MEDENADKHDSRTDDKTAAEYNLVAGDTLHLVLALRGGRWLA